MCEEYELPPRKQQTVVGIDIGVKSLVVTSNGETFGNPKYNQKYEKKIKRLQKSLSRKIKGSNNYKKNKIQLARCYQKLRNARKKLVEKIVSKVTEYNDIIVCEKLKVKENIDVINVKVEIERDLNASINIMYEGLITYYKKNIVKIKFNKI